MPVTQVSKSQCIALQSNPGYYLRKDAAYAWDRAVADFGKQVLITGSWRSYEIQEQLFDSEKHPATGRYVRGNRAGQRGYTTDVRGRTADGGLYRGSWWTRKAGTAAAAVPGTSNHGGGVAVDVKTARQKGDPSYADAVIFASWSDADRTRFLKVAAEHGWYDDEGREVGELWHLTYYPERDQHHGEKPTPENEEDTMNKDQEAKLDDALWNARQAKAALDEFAPVLWNVRQIKAQMDAQAAVIEVLAKNAGADPKAITAAIDKALEGLTITLTTPKEA